MENDDFFLHGSYVKGDLGAVTSLLSKFQKAGFKAEPQDIALLIRHSERLRSSLSKLERALTNSKPARAASAKGGVVKGEAEGKK